ncbi:CapA family protein [bacterium]|nr:MAG: CapA family protein [bacterium]
MKNFLFILLIVLIIGGGFFLYSQKAGWDYKNIMEKNKTLEINDTKKSLTFIFVGDIMLSRAVGDKMEKENDWTWPFLKIGDWLKNADITFGNLEGPISDKGMNVGSIYSFRADPRSIEGLKYAGFDVLSVANNHMGDWAVPAFEDTLEKLKNAEIDYIGGGHNQKEAYGPLKKEINGTSFCFFAYTDLGPRSFEAGTDSPGMAFLDIELAQKDIEKYKKNCDIIIVSLHFGEEYKEKATSRQKVVAKALVNAGADLIIGHHSHVISEVETIGDAYVYYGLGNFVFDQMFSEKTCRGIALVAEVKDKKFINVVPHEIYINDFFQPELSSDKKLSTR